MKVNFKTKLTRNIINVPGWRTSRKIIVIESDDWGSIRMSSGAAYSQFLKNKIPVDKCPYNRNDSLESNEDMEMLFETLSSVKDKNNRPAVITANNIVANPDFDKIRLSGFMEYFFEPFPETYKRYPSHNRVMTLYREGIEKKIFVPQFHGREHVNVQRWLRALQSEHKAIHMAFNQSMFSIHTGPGNPIVNELMDALDGDSETDLKNKSLILGEGLNLFKKIWGFNSKSFIAPCYIWQPSVEQIIANYGVRYIQGMVVQLVPIEEPGYRYKKKYHYQGQRNKYGQYYLVRNVFFEPSSNPGFDWVNDCMHRIEIAFKWNKPAIISSHRVNFMGWLKPENRGYNLNLLLSLLKSIKKRWPEVEFMSTDELGDLISNKIRLVQ